MIPISHPLTPIFFFIVFVLFGNGSLSVNTKNITFLFWLNK